MARIVVVGAGVGAMAAAARLAVAGHSVTVVERRETHGGAVGSRVRDGFRFDTGPGLLYLPAVWRDLFVKTGKRSLEECVDLVRPADPVVEHRLPDGSRVRLPGLSRGGTVRAVREAFGDRGVERWTAVLGRAREAWEVSRRPLMEEPLTAGTDTGPLRRDPYPAVPRRRGLLRRPAPPEDLLATAGRELGDPRLVALLTAGLWDWGVHPVGAPAGALVLPYVEQTFGTWYPLGGMRALADALHARCVERRVEFRFDVGVIAVTEGAGRATGVELTDGTVLPAEHVVVGGWSPPLLPADRVPAETRATDTTGAGCGDPRRKPPGNAVRAWSRATLLLALRGPRPTDTPHRTVVHGASPEEPPVTVLQPDDPSLWPAGGHATAVVTVPVPAGSGGGLPAGTAARLDAAADAVVPNRADREVWRELRTPAEIERETGAPGGAVPGPALAGGVTGRSAALNPGPLPGTYRVGGLAHPGGGLAQAGMTGAMVAGLIVEGPDWHGSY
ncbi:NAD(P)/FAD-dependent oxidoreductase [Streptomyces sp. ST2-7A]|uniref:phytoene desaturase family protein n=1 Tax=Streptomyces sp. ST2-7A TaxID=2907214 RepID=UPI001F384BF6|nr:NAD(P)/FAD-dependent oxidoreductase [Streptomyces sp. ST2-7A]MCE7083144.1 NAD(P)/FAD-dependent oxidoreductase [Streptomyces sp. ST2-7A]